MYSSSVPMSWVWERFRNTFRSSAEDSSDDVDVETVRLSQLIENTVYLIISGSGSPMMGFPMGGH